jgi:hypothetical protein
VPIEGVAAGEVTLTAAREGSGTSVSLPVTVIGATQEPEVVEIRGGGTVLQGATASYTVVLDIPAPAGGSLVTLTANGGVGTVPADVTVPEDMREASFTLTAADAPVSGGSLQADLGASSVTLPVEVVDPSALLLDLDGWTLQQQNSARSFTFPAGTEVQVGGYVVIGRNASKAQFETFWGVTLAANVVYLDSGDQFIALNGDETFELRDDTGANVDGPTLAIATGLHYERKVPVAAAGDAGSWTDGAFGDATPGAGQAANATAAGIYVSEIADPTGSGNFNYEFVELYYDAPLE